MSAEITSQGTGIPPLRVGDRVAFLQGKTPREGTFIRQDGKRLVLSDRSGTSIYLLNTIKGLRVTQASTPTRIDKLQVGARVAFLFGTDAVPEEKKSLREGTFVRRVGDKMVLADGSGTSIYPMNAVKKLSATVRSRPARLEDLHVGMKVAFLCGTDAVPEGMKSLREGTFVRRVGDKMVLSDGSGTSPYPLDTVNALHIVG